MNNYIKSNPKISKADNFESLNISVIIILYFPELENVLKTIDILLSENVSIIIVDNTPNHEEIEIKKIELDNENIKYIPLFENKGIATSQNIGIEVAKSIKGITHILLLDQDSIIEKKFVKLLYSEYINISNIGIKISVLSPTLIDIKNGEPYKKKKLKDYNTFFITDKTSSSGSLISISSFNIVGGFEDDLFIDLVDSEWCWRSSSLGLNVCVSKKIKMQHSIGETNHVFFGYKIIVSAPFRYFYQYRNWIRLLSRSYVPLEWKVKTTLKNSINLFLIPLKEKHGISYLKNMLKGIKESIILLK